MTNRHWEEFKALLTVVREQMIGDDGTWALHSDISEALKRSARLIGLQPPLQAFWSNTLNGITAKLTSPTGDVTDVTLEIEGAAVELNRAFAAAARRKVDRLIDEWLEFSPAEHPATPTPSENLPLNGAPERADHHVTLLQMAKIISQSKRSLERWVTKEVLPPPDVDGGAGKANLWKWSTVRPILQRESGITLPEIFPASQRL